LNEQACFSRVRNDNGRMVYEKGCKQPLACKNNQDQNGRPASIGRQCNPYLQGSVCTCCCTKNKCNERTMLCQKDTPQPAPKPRCRALTELENGDTKCTPIKRPTMKQGSVCRFTCNQGYVLVGAESSKCVDDEKNGVAKFSEPLPTCKPTCPRQPDEPLNGFKECVGSERSQKCVFQCKVGFSLVGSKTSTCDMESNLNSSGWSDETPECKEIKCQPIDELFNGGSKCTSGFKVGSKCSFFCDCKNGYALYPSNSSDTQCILTEANTAVWDPVVPCCQRECPTYLKMDMVILLDSSSSVGNENFEIQRGFTKKLIGLFDLAEDTGRISVVRYNIDVDITSEITLKDSSILTNQQLLEKVSEIPYDGRGTRTGKALKYVRKSSFSRYLGSRSGVAKLVVLITDAKAQDQKLAEEEAEKMRGDGVLIYTIGVGLENETDKDDLVRITGSERRFIQGNSITDLKDSQILEELKETLCKDQCTFAA